MKKIDLHFSLFIGSGGNNGWYTLPSWYRFNAPLAIAYRRPENMPYKGTGKQR